MRKLSMKKQAAVTKDHGKQRKRKGKTRKQGNKNPQRIGFLDTNLEHRISKANSAFYSYAAPIYRHKDIHMRHKLKNLKMTALPTLLYAAEIRAISKDEIRRLDCRCQKCSSMDNFELCLRHHCCTVPNGARTL